MEIKDQIWLAADYHFPATYSLRMPMSSMSSALALPAPGPATVRLALVRNGIELFGLEHVRDELFPWIRAAEVLIRPPERVAISLQLLHAYKANDNASHAPNRVRESIIYREMAHASGLMTIFIRVPFNAEAECRETLMNIGYWGQSSSLACCVGVNHGSPLDGEVGIPMGSANATHSLRGFYPSISSEFRDTEVGWNEIMPQLGTRKPYPLSNEVFLWPMVVCERRGGSKLLQRHSIGY